MKSSTRKQIKERRDAKRDVNILKDKPTLDGRDSHYNVRRLDNMVRVTIHERIDVPDYCYVSLECLRDTDEMDEGQVVRRWEHLKGSTYPGGVSFAKARDIAEDFYKDAEVRLKKLDPDFLLSIKKN